MKLKQVDLYKTSDVPDHLLQEVVDVTKKFLEAILPLLDSERPNLSLSAINYVLATITKAAVSDDISEQRRAALHQAKAIIGNIAMLNGLSIDEFIME